MGGRWFGLVCLLGAVLGCGSPDAPVLPDESELASLPLPELADRFEAIDRALARRGLSAEASVERADAGHRALVAYRRRPDARVERVARRLLTPASVDRAAGGVSCEASRDLAELERATGRDAAALRVVERALADGTGTLTCRESLRELGSALGLVTGTTTPASVRSGTGRGTAITALEILGADGTLGRSVEGGVRSVRLVLTLDRDARGELVAATTTGEDRRASLRFDAVRIAPALALPRSVGAGGLLRIEASADGSAIEFVLDPEAQVRGYVLASPPRWVIDVERGDAANPEPVAGGPRLVMLDPGHGGDEHGARIDGVRESHLVLDIASRAANELRRRLPGTRVLLTRTTDDEVSLEQRSALANALGADLFVSIHLNDSDVPVQTGGITTFVLDTSDDSQALRLAARENATTTDRVSGLSALLAGLHRDTQVGESRRLASFVHQSTLGRARTVLPRLPDRGVRSAMFYVLVGTRMPSILLEASFMTRPEELAALRTEAYRQVLAEGIAEGIARYAATRP